MPTCRLSLSPWIGTLTIASIHHLANWTGFGRASSPQLIKVGPEATCETSHTQVLVEMVLSFLLNDKDPHYKVWLQVTELEIKVKKLCL